MCAKGKKLRLSTKKLVNQVRLAILGKFIWTVQMTPMTQWFMAKMDQWSVLHKSKLNLALPLNLIHLTVYLSRCHWLLGSYLPCLDLTTKDHREVPDLEHRWVSWFCESAPCSGKSWCQFNAQAMYSLLAIPSILTYRQDDLYLGVSLNPNV